MSGLTLASANEARGLSAAFFSLILACGSSSGRAVKVLYPTKNILPSFVAEVIQTDLEMAEWLLSREIEERAHAPTKSVASQTERHPLPEAVS